MCIRDRDGVWVAAICAAPSVLGHLGLLKGRTATCYPGFEQELTGAQVTGVPVEVSENFITGRGAGAAMAFALKLGTVLCLSLIHIFALKDNDTVSFPEAKKTLIAIYGDALGQPVPLQIELEEFETRLERLKQAYEEGKETEAKDTQERVKNAIMAHENRIALLKKKMCIRDRERRLPPAPNRAPR